LVILFIYGYLKPIGLDPQAILGFDMTSLTQKHMVPEVPLQRWFQVEQQALSSMKFSAGWGVPQAA